MASDPASTPAPVPIACSLDMAAMPGRLDEWQRALVGVVAREPLAGGVRLVLDDGADLGEISRLMTAEHACCPFFSFALTVDARGVALEVSAPPDGAAVVAAAFGSAP